MKKVLLLSLFSLFFLFGCEQEEMNLPSSYPNLNGSYTFSDYRSWSGGLYEISKYESWDFDKTRKAWYYYKNWSYTSSGWTNALKESHSYYMEWKVVDGVFWERLWDNEYSEWQSHTFEYISSTSFKLDGNLYVKD
jgi:hypothetical protein